MGFRIFLSACLACAVSLATAQTVAPVSSVASSDETKPPIQLSPFEVIEDTKGYFSGNTTSGTRLNSRLEDLAAAITVVTKEQMSDFAMLDLNDVFLYATSTVGFGARVLDGLSLTYNESDSFIPQGPQQDLFRHLLPNTRGEGKDYGFWLNLNDGKFVLRVNRFEAKRIKTRNGDAATIAQRALNMDLSGNNAYQLEDQARAWVTAANPAWTAAQIQAEVARQTGLSIEEQNELTIPDPGISATQDVEARGTELELNFNPTRFWTVTGSVTETRTTSIPTGRSGTRRISTPMRSSATARDSSRKKSARPFSSTCAISAKTAASSPSVHTRTARRWRIGSSIRSCSSCR